MYISTKLSFLSSIKNNYISSTIFDFLCVNKSNSKRFSKSFVQDIKLLENHFNYGISVIFENPLSFKKLLKKQSTLPNGILDSINICLTKYKSRKFKKMLDDLTKPQFIRDDEDFQELLQYLIIAGYSWMFFSFFINCIFIYYVINHSYWYSCNILKNSRIVTNILINIFYIYIFFRNY